MATTVPKLLEPNPISLAEALMDRAKRVILEVQDYSLLSLRSLTNLFHPPYYISDVLDQMDIIGVGIVADCGPGGLFHRRSHGAADGGSV